MTSPESARDSDGFKDHFSRHATQYAQARPHYPAALFQRLAALAPCRERAWDAGCGNGQASVALAAFMADVYATDPSADQIANARSHPRVRYAVERAEQCGLPDASVDLAVIAQALHWCIVDDYHAEVRRVLRPGGVVAEVGYARCSVTAAIDAEYAHLYEHITAPYWPPERALVDAHYAGLPFPFAPIAFSALPPMRQDWTLAQYLDYLDSWSASVRFRGEHGHSPVAAMADRFRDAWGDPAQPRAVTWDLFLRVGRR